MEERILWTLCDGDPPGALWLSASPLGGVVGRIIPCPYDEEAYAAILREAADFRRVRRELNGVRNLDSKSGGNGETVTETVTAVTPEELVVKDGHFFGCMRSGQYRTFSFQEGASDHGCRVLIPADGLMHEVEYTYIDHSLCPGPAMDDESWTQVSYALVKQTEAGA